MAAIAAAPLYSLRKDGPRLNVLFIAVDDLRPGLGCYGDRDVKTPHIDRLARSGVLFERAYCQFPLCAPSRASLLTGARPDSTRVQDLYTDFRAALGAAPTMPEWFKRHGYYADRFGKIFHIDDVQSWTQSRPAEAFGPGNPVKRAPYASSAINEAGWRKFDAAQAAGLTGVALERSQRGPAYEIADMADDELVDGQTAQQGIAALRAASQSGEPFFLAVGFNKPHLPFVAPRRYWELYDRALLPVPRNVQPPADSMRALDGSAEFYSYTDVPKERPIPDEYARLAQHGYRACISFVDAQIGRLLEELDRLGLGDYTVVVLWGDHGFKLGEHGEWGKQSAFELDARVPLIVRAPGCKAGAQAAGLVELVDIYPTLAEICGLPLPDHLEGDSFVALLREPGRNWKPAAFTQCRAGNRAGYSVRTERYRFTRWSSAGAPDVIELYDHQSDPAENHNLAGKPELARIQEELAAQLHTGWRGARP